MPEVLPAVAFLQRASWHLVYGEDLSVARPNALQSSQPSLERSRFQRLQFRDNRRSHAPGKTFLRLQRKPTLLPRHPLQEVRYL